MRNNHFFKLVLLAFSLILSITACDKESKDEISVIESKDITAKVQQDFDIDALLDDLAFESEENADDANFLKSASLDEEQESCKTREVTLDSKKRKVITVTYDEGCEDDKGNVRSGTMIITILKGNIIEKGAKRKIEYVDFTINGKVINGKKWITNLISQRKGDGSEAKPKKSQLVYFDLEIELEDGTKIHKKGKRTRMWVKGGFTKDKTDDVYLIRGFVKADDISEEGLEEKDNTTKIEGNMYFKKIVKSLKKHNDYPFFTRGVKRIIENSDTLWINYGDGTKDSLATVKVNSGEYEEIVLE